MIPRLLVLSSLLAFGCSSNTTSGSDAGDASCPMPGPPQGPPGTPPQGAHCPMGYCWMCQAVDLPEGCPTTYCLTEIPIDEGMVNCVAVCD